MATTMTTRPKGTDAADRDPESTAGTTARKLAGSVKTTAEDAAARLPEAASTARGAIAEAGRTIRSESDERLSAGALLSFGLALGLLIGGANRLLILAALIPTTVMGITLLDRGWRLQGRR